jgi:hypothetical protein
MDIKEITKTAGITALFACGHQGPTSTAPPAVVAYARAFAAAVAGLAGASIDGKEAVQWHTAPEDQIGSALYALARDGLIPGGQSDPSATGYLFRQKGGGPTGRPSPRGRLALARAAGANVRAIVVGKADKLELTEDGDVAHLDLHPDDRPVSWGDIRGVAVRVDDLRTGERITAWVSAAEIGSRKDKGSDRGGGWATDAVGMAATKAISIAVSRGIVPQASLIPSIVGAHGPVAPRALTIEAAAAPRQIAEPTPAAPPPAEPEPTPEPTGAPSGLTIYTALADVKGWLGAQAPDGEIVERALSKQFALLQIASRTNGETVDRDSLTHDQHRKIVAGALAELQARPQPEAPAEPERPEAPSISEPPRRIGISDLMMRIHATTDHKFTADDAYIAVAPLLKRAAAVANKKGLLWVDDDISPVAADWIVAEAVKTLRSM